jgi:hypothetical protein
MNAHHILSGDLAHIAWLLHHHYTRRALLEMRQIVWALKHGGVA